MFKFLLGVPKVLSVKFYIFANLNKSHYEEIFCISSAGGTFIHRHLGSGYPGQMEDRRRHGNRRGLQGRRCLQWQDCMARGADNEGWKPDEGCDES